MTPRHEGYDKVRVFFRGCYLTVEHMGAMRRVSCTSDRSTRKIVIERGVRNHIRQEGQLHMIVAEGSMSTVSQYLLAEVRSQNSQPSLWLWSSRQRSQRRCICLLFMITSVVNPM